jgi:ATP-dependent exoDNAse (exonuclease V) alpha subunit
MARSPDGGWRALDIGDRVLCRHNDRQLGVRNGTRATVAALDESTLSLQTDAGSTRRVPLSYAVTHVDHGYAFTGHAAQGATVDRTFVLAGDQGSLHEWGYVACSRARTETRLYLSAPTPDLTLTEQSRIVGMRPTALPAR